MISLKVLHNNLFPNNFFKSIIISSLQWFKKGFRTFLSAFYGSHIEKSYKRTTISKELLINGNIIQFLYQKPMLFHYYDM